VQPAHQIASNLVISLPLKGTNVLSATIIEAEASDVEPE
jgi:hypothetical protein